MRKSTTPLTPAQVYRGTTHLIQRHLTLKPTRRVAVPTLWAILLCAAARVSSISDTCRRPRGVPDEMATFAALHAALPEFGRLQRQVQAALRDAVPATLRARPRDIAADLVLIPYYGRPDGLPLYRGREDRGTRWFWAYATAYVVCHGQRLTLGLRPVTRADPLGRVLKDLLGQVRACGVAIRKVLLDRGFYSVAVVRYPQAARTAFILPVVPHGRRPSHPKGPSGSYVFWAWRRGGWSEYTLRDRAGRPATITIAVKRRRGRSRRGRRHRGVWVYGCWGLPPRSINWIKDTYRKRFGIESSYRQMNQGRIRTRTDDARLRYLFVALGLLLRNVWAWLHHAVLSRPRRGRREYRWGRLRLRTLLRWLEEVIIATYGLVTEIDIERNVPQWFKESAPEFLR